MSDEHKSLNEIIRFRKEKLDTLRERGVNPYPYNYKPTHTSGEILENYDDLEEKDVTVAGRIMALRKMGKASFFHIQDMGGRIQVYIKRDEVDEDAYANFKLMDIGDIVGVRGYPFTTKSGEKSIHAKEFTVLAKSIRPLPVVKEKDGETFDAFEDKELRYRNRHLDLIVNPDVKDIFVKRAKIIATIRQYLDEMNFLEVETPILQPLYGGANARPFSTHHNALDQQLYLRIADELYLKRLIVGGIDRVYEISKDFRNEGMDKNHNPEFTMLEFYWAYADYEDNMKIVEDMVRKTAEAVNATHVTWHDNGIDLSKSFARKPILKLLKEATGQDLGSATNDKMKKLCKSHNIDVENNANYGQMLDALLDALVIPNLLQPTFVIDYPKAISPLAKAHRSGDPNLVERFELFIGGAEFANSFTELNDPIDQRERLEAQAQLREQGDEVAQLVDENFIQAMECGMPPTGGVGLGIDRLTMLLTEQHTIKDVILFPAMRTVDE
ncbi:MAG: lysine--tRNA ligase [Candidatus Neomarinimicrobiota bacterium]|nr:MAG: lysine--tRNA ligase [Candidatus Neomarinimicrobiota bacterium]